MKWLGAALVLAASVLVGQWACRQLREKVELLRGLQQGLLAMEQEMRYAGSRMEQVFHQGGESADMAAPLFFQAEALLKNRTCATAGEAWDLALQDKGYDRSEDTVFLGLLATGLGNNSLDGTLRSFSLCRERLNRAEQAAEERRLRWSRVWASLSWSFGVLLILVML